MGASDPKIKMNELPYNNPKHKKLTVQVNGTMQEMGQIKVLSKGSHKPVLKAKGYMKDHKPQEVHKP